jgi:hypothetical protein
MGFSLGFSFYASAPHWQQATDNWQLFELVADAKIILPPLKQNGFDPL